MADLYLNPDTVPQLLWSLVSGTKEIALSWNYVVAGAFWSRRLGQLSTLKWRLWTWRQNMLTNYRKHSSASHQPDERQFAQTKKRFTHAHENRNRKGAVRGAAGQPRWGARCHHQRRPNTSRELSSDCKHEIIKKRNTNHETQIWRKFNRKSSEWQKVYFKCTSLKNNFKSMYYLYTMFCYIILFQCLLLKQLSQVTG